MTGELTDEAAVGLASRWSWWHDGGVDREKQSPPHTAEKMLTWVRRELEREAAAACIMCGSKGQRERCSGCPPLTEHIAWKLGITEKVAREIVEEARRP